MLCDFFILSRSVHGKVVMCKKCDNKVALMFNNISQSFTFDAMRELKNAIMSVNVNTFFERYPAEKRIHLRTHCSDLYFSFTENEIDELRSLLCDADEKLKLIVYHQKSLN